MKNHISSYSVKETTFGTDPGVQSTYSRNLLQNTVMKELILIALGFAYAAVVCFALL